MALLGNKTTTSVGVKTTPDHTELHYGRVRYNHEGVKYVLAVLHSPTKLQSFEDLASYMKNVSFNRRALCSVFLCTIYIMSSR